MESHRIGVISDTHGILRPEVEAVLGSCEIILHAGDIGKPEILGRLKAITDTCAVLGNTDRFAAEQLSGESGERLPAEELEIELFGFRIYMIHNKKQIRKNLEGVDIVVCGHSHRYEAASRGRTTWLNPGSCGPKRFRLPVTMMILTLYPQEHRLETERIDCLAHGQTVQDASGRGTYASGKEIYAGSRESARPDIVSAAEDEMQIPKQDMNRLVRVIMKEIDAGRKISDIAARNQIDERFTEEVCRMYVTHPGVDVDGILDRIERKNL